MSEKLPDDVYIELGKLMWDLLYLEDLAESLVAPLIDKPNRLTLGPLLEAGIRELAPNQQLEGIARAKEWLEAVLEIIPYRNALAHGTQCSFYPTLEDIKMHNSETPQIIQHVDKHGRVTSIEMKSESLSSLRRRISPLRNDWRDVCLNLREASKLLKSG